MESKQIEIEISYEAEEHLKLLDATFGDKDIFFYSGDIDGNTGDLVSGAIESLETKKKAYFAISTYGGDPDSAYRMSRYLQEKYEDWIAVVPGYCKSAGTLFVLGADEIAMAGMGELGPLDIQLLRPDEFMKNSSALCITQALDLLASKSFEAFEESFLNLRKRSGGQITTKTAGDIASTISVGLFKEIAEKVDPHVLGEVQRANQIGLHYGVRLGAPERIVRRLMQHYPSHSFVIDRKEASGILENCRAWNSVEKFVFSVVDSELEDASESGILEYPRRQPMLCQVILSFSKKELEEKETKNEDEKTTTEE